MRYQIRKIKNGQWALETENGHVSTHSTQWGAEQFLMQLKGPGEEVEEGPDFDGAEWLGEDGAMVCYAKTKREALSKFKTTMRLDCGDVEARELRYEDITVGYARKASEEELRENPDYDYYVNYSGKPEMRTPFKCYVMRA